MVPEYRLQTQRQGFRFSGQVYAKKERKKESKNDGCREERILEIRFLKLLMGNNESLIGKKEKGKERNYQKGMKALQEIKRKKENYEERNKERKKTKNERNYRKRIKNYKKERKKERKKNYLKRK